MARKARIENGLVVEVLDADPFPPFAADLIWLDCPAEVEAKKHGWDGVEFLARPGRFYDWNGSAWVHNTLAENKAAIEAVDAADKATVKLEAQVQSFIAMTPAEVNAYIDTQVTDLASAKAVLKFFGRMLLILVRREYR